eukprot:gene6513-4692_t
MRMRNDVTIAIPDWARRGGDDNNYMDWQSDHLRVAQREIELTQAEAQRTWAAMTEEAKTELLDAAAVFFHQQRTRKKPKKTEAKVEDYRRYLQLLRENNPQAAEEMDTRFPGIMPLLGVGGYFWVHHREGNGETLHERLLHSARAAMVATTPTVVASSTPTSSVSAASGMVQTATSGMDGGVIDFDEEEAYDGLNSGDGPVQPDDDAAAVAAVTSTAATSDDVPSTTVDLPAIAADDSTANGDNVMEMDGEGDSVDGGDQGTGMATSCAATVVEETNDVTEASDWENDLPVLLPATVPLIDTSHEATETPLDMDMDMDIDATDTGHVAEPSLEDASHENIPLEVVKSPLAALQDTAASTPPDTDDSALDQQGIHDGLEAPGSSEKVTTICEGIHVSRGIRKGDTVKARDEQGHFHAARVLHVDVEGNLVVHYMTGEFECILASDFDRRIASWQDGHIRAGSVPTSTNTMGNKISPTTFYEYCQEGNLAAVQTILSQVSPYVKEKLFAHRVEEMPMLSTPLFTAIQHHHLPVVQLLLDYGINPNSQIKTFGRSSSETALMHAISWRNAMIVDVLLRYRADSERPDAHGKTALHKACALRDSSLKDMSSIVEIVDVLLKHRADLDAVDKSGNLPLHWASILLGHVAIAQALLDHVEFYRHAQQRHTQHTGVVKGWETMYARGLSIACRKQRRDMVAMMLRHGQTAGVFASSPLDRWGSVSLSTDDSTEDSTTNVEEIFRTLSQQARDDPIITALLQQYLLPPASAH